MSNRFSGARSEVRRSLILPATVERSAPCHLRSLRPQLPDGVRLELLPPKSYRTRNRPPEWSVWLGSARIGQIEQWSVRSSSSTFYRATALHPEAGKPIPLESSTDLTEQVERVVSAWREPESYIHRPSWEQRA